MSSNTKNVKLGVCQVFYKGQDLGYTKGGVEVSVTSQKHEVNVDQFGKTAVNELIMGREVKAKVPMAETTIENMVAVMPGAELITIGGVVALGSVQVATNPAANDTIVLNGITLTFKVAASSPNEVTLGATKNETAANLAAVLNASTEPALAAATYSVATDTVSVKYGNSLIYSTNGMKGTEGNSYTLGAGTAGVKVTLSGATLTGGTEPTSKIVSVTTGVGISLLDIAQELRLHPISKVATDLSEDFIIPKAGTAGALSYSYKDDTERVFSVEFTGYPDSVTGKLFSVGGRA